MSFNTRNCLILCLFILVLLVGLTISLNRLEYSSFLRYVKSNAVSQIEHIEWIIENNRNIDNTAELQSLLVNLGKDLNCRISYLNKQGRILADSLVNRKKLASEKKYLSHKDISISRQETYGINIDYSRKLAMQTLGIVKQVDIQLADAGEGTLRLAMPVPDEFSGLNTQQLLCMFAFILMGVTAACILSIFFTRPVKKALHTLQKSVQDFAAGNLEKRIDLVQVKDFSPLIRSLNQMAKSLQSRFEYVESQKEQSRAIINGMYEGLIVLDQKGRVKLVNSRVEKDLAISSQILGKKPIEIIKSPELQDICKEMLQDPEQTSSSVEIELSGQRHFHTSLVKLCFEEKLPEIIIVLHDISEIKKLEKIRKDFVANISHELRTPLTSIKGYAETLLSVQPEDKETMTCFVQTIQKNVDNIQHLLQDLIQLASLESREEEVELKTVNAISAFQDSWETCRPMAEEKKIQLVDKFPENELAVKSKHKQLARVFTNLLENGIKYSFANEKLTVGAFQENKEVIFFVQDHGPGVPSQLQDRIFERFFREEGISSARDGSGSGLGLAICKHIVNSHGGSIWVQSPIPGEIQGSIFYFKLENAQN